MESELPTFQSIIEALLLATGASRATLQWVAPGKSLVPAAEAVAHGARQLCDEPPGGEAAEAAALLQLEHARKVVVQDDLRRDDSPAARTLAERHGVRARMLAPLVLAGRLTGFISVHHVPAPRPWAAQDIAALLNAQAAALALLEARAGQASAMAREDLRDAAIQAVLDGLRQELRVGRCTLRQNIGAAQAFPVTHESRAAGVRALRGDFTIDQRVQPVVLKLAAERVQVVQDDTRNASADPAFHTMLQHYGDMRAQRVTPLFHGDRVAGAVSVHSLGELRSWTPEETALARSASRLLGLLIGATLA
jgi:GAF domain-containing protein